MSEAETDRQTRGVFGSLSFKLRILLFLAILFAGALIAVISQRQEIARELLSDELEEQGIDATYEIEEVGLEKQIVRNIKIGDPDAPDATIERMIIELRPEWGAVAIDGIIVEGLRIYGSYKDGYLSFGTLDPYLQSDSDGPPELPEWQLTLKDARGHIDTDYGVIGLSADGSGYLQNGFRGNIAAISRQLDYNGCRIERPTLYGEISIRSGRPKFNGPARFDSLICPAKNVRVGQSDIQLALNLSNDFETLHGETVADIEKARLFGMVSDHVTASTDFSWNAGNLTGQADLTAINSAYGDVRSRQFSFTGDFSASDNFTAAKVDGDVQVRQMAIPGNVWQGLSEVARGNGDTPIGPLLTKFIRAARPQTDNMSLTTPLVINYRDGVADILLKDADLLNSGGEAIFTARDVRVKTSGNGLKNATGEFAVTGQGLPQLSAEFDALSINSFRVRAQMLSYASGSSSLALPMFVVQKNGSGAYGFSGRAMVSGPLPDGYVWGLRVPLKGGWTRQTGLRMYNECQDFEFAALKYASIRTNGRFIRICPDEGRPIIAQRGNDYIVSASLPDGQFGGYLGDTPIDIQAGNFAFALPGQVRAKNLTILIGEGDTATRIVAGQFNGTLGDRVSGSFDNANANIANVPLDLTEGRGRLEFANSVLDIQVDNWRVSDQAERSRFEPLVTHDAQIRLQDGIITANALLHEPETDAAIVNVDIRHDLGNSRGGADLTVADISFNDRLQPEMLTGLALGVVANVDGQVRGQGRIDWSSVGVSSAGRFRTDDMDLAAAFGPVAGLSGEIEFTDLLALETAPGQLARMDEVNPGIAALDGVIRYQLISGQRMKIEGGEWPFAGGKLFLEPTILDFSEEKVRNLVFRIEGLDAAKFLLRFDFDNLAATGIFDGRLPMVFDQNGGRIDGGRLDVRSEGGTLAYIGQLTYEDLSPMANFAFNALRAMEYDELTIRMNGPLDGEIITDVNMEGVRQGVQAQKNFITRQLAKLPIVFKIRIKAPFMQLINTGRSLYDAEYIPDPVAAGLLRRLPPLMPDTDRPPQPETFPQEDTENEGVVQPLESENMR
ncbi:YdbH domain-containing protein [Sphingorhabdus sp. Alg239-R122]|uniref:YdbH domain-containing protein n=1 Tax=Sphingorhabdus sp. Alg239-R122 TaxID=2305989 RepID=UPI0013DAE58A|nr:YdbH domain-containing protein [Sphingorhabdus sp. Alg239-R122]